MTTVQHWQLGDNNFPSCLAGIPGPPRELYAVGRKETLDAPRVAIVGTRHPTPYGERVTHQLATALASAGACVVSGMATGIDSCAHNAALKAKGKTIAVLGLGIDQPYPATNVRLYNEIAVKGLLISELAPGAKAFKGCFPRRNRIIAGLCSLTIVVEAPIKSGALITADYASDADRVIAAVPGSIESPQSEGTNRLIRDGAQVIATVDDALALLNLTAPNTTSKSQPLGSDEATIWDLLATPGLKTDDIISRTNWPACRCAVAITNLEIQGLVACLLTGEIRRI